MPGSILRSMSPLRGSDFAGPRPVGARPRLVAAAVGLFQARGYHGVGTAEILAEAHAPRGSLYHHFPGGKEELAIAAVKWLADDIVQTIRDLRLDGASSPDILETIARSVAGWLIKTDFLQAGLLGALSSGLHHEQSRLRNAIAEAYERIETEYVRMMTVDKMGEAKARSLARTWLVTMEGAILLARVQRDATVVLGALLPVAAQAGCAQR